MALPTDRAEAEGLLLSGEGLVDLDAVAELEGAYSSFPPAEETVAPIDVSALDTIDLGLGVQLFGGNDVLTLGGVDQYSSSQVGSAYAASGLLTDDGGIQAGTGAPGENTTLRLGPVLDDLDVDGLISDLTLDLGSVSASATAVRTAGGVTTTGDYQISSGKVTLTAPLLSDVVTALDADLADASADINALAADGGPIDDTVDGLLGGIDGILEDLLPGLLDLDDPEVTATLALNLDGVIDTVADDAFVSGPVTLTLSTGEIVIDLEQLYGDLNERPVNQELVSDAAVNPLIAEALSDILTEQLPDALSDAVSGVLNTTALDIDVAAGVDLLSPPAGDLAIAIDGTLGGFLALPGSTPPAVSFDDTEIVDLEVDELREPVTDYVIGSILPAVGGVVDAELGALETSTTDTLTDAVTALDPVLEAVSTVVSITVNVQEAPGEFRDPLGTDAGSFTQRAATIVVAPGLAGGAIELNLASATVRAVPLAAPAGLAIDPGRGPVTGGTTVTITGDNLDGTTGVTFGGVPATSFTPNADGTLTAVTPAQAAPGTVPVAVTNPDGTDSTLAFEYFAASVDEIDPDSGTTSGGDEITITGECLTGATGVTFGGVEGTDFVVVSDTEITVTTPPGAPGTVDVVVVNPTACGSVTAPDGFAYVVPGAPTLTDIEPDRGPETGGTEVTITGEDFLGTTSVTFDGVEATEFDIVSDTGITAITPAGTPGIVDVIVTNGAGASAPFDFEYFDVTEIDTVTPDEGPEDGGNIVTIMGDCLTGATAVLFGGTPSADFTVVSDTVITAEVPAGVGVVDVTVVGIADCGPGTIDEGYEYFAPPVITELEPGEGPENGGTPVTITGSGFEGTTGVLFGTTPGTDLIVVSDTEITVVTPPGTPGTVTVTVEHPGGDTDAGDFLYLDIPGITSLTPTEGPEDGGTVVTIIGEGFDGATGVTFGDEDGVGFVVVSDTEITVTTPAHAPATVPVVVLHPNGDSPAASFTFIEGTEIGTDDPVIGTITPTSGPETGGTVVTITGSNLTGAEVRFGGLLGTDLVIVSDSELRVTSPAHAPGTVDVVVITGAGTSDPGEFTYYPVTAVDDSDATVGGALPATGGEAAGFGPLAALGLMLLVGGGLLATAVGIRRRTA